MGRRRGRGGSGGLQGLRPGGQSAGKKPVTLPSCVLNLKLIWRHAFKSERISCNLCVFGNE